MGSVSKGTVWPILNTVASSVCLIHTCTGLIVAKVVASLCVPRSTMEVGAPVERGGTDRALVVKAI